MILDFVVGPASLPVHAIVWDVDVRSVRALVFHCLRAWAPGTARRLRTWRLRSPQAVDTIRAQEETPGRAVSAVNSSQKKAGDRSRRRGITHNLEKGGSAVRDVENLR